MMWVEWPTNRASRRAPFEDEGRDKCPETRATQMDHVRFTEGRREIVIRSGRAGASIPLNRLTATNLHPYLVTRQSTASIDVC